MNLPIQTTKGLFFYYRPDTTDEKVIPEVVTKHAYTRKDFQILSDDVWADLGADIGTFSSVIGQAGAKGVAYEPEPQNFEMLSANITLNHFEHQIQLHNIAVTLKGGDVILYKCKSPRNKYRHSVLPHNKWLPITIQSVTMDSVLQSGVDCIKMDIEGAELEILDAHLDWSGIKRLVFEYHFDLDKHIPTFLNRIERLAKYFTNIHYSKLPMGESYNFFPAAKIVYCQR